MVREVEINCAELRKEEFHLKGGFFVQQVPITAVKTVSQVYVAVGGLLPLVPGVERLH